MLKPGTIRPFGLSTLFLLAFFLILAGCDVNSPGITTPTVERTPKGPGAANLTATALTTPVATVCPTFSAAPASTSGWKLYKDMRFAFQFAIPPGWKAGSFTDDTGDDYIAAVLPANSTFPFDHVSGAPEQFQISVALAGAPRDPTIDPNMKPEANPVTISEAKTTLYDGTPPDCQGTERMAVATIGQHQFVFYMSAHIPTLSKVQKDLSLFLGTLQSFAYTG
jgi:hypothetical protein